MSKSPEKQTVACFYSMFKSSAQDTKLVTYIITYQTSVFEVNMPSKNASGGIHLMGSIAFPPFL